MRPSCAAISTRSRCGSPMHRGPTRSWSPLPSPTAGGRCRGSAGCRSMRSRAKTASAEPEVPAGDMTTPPAARPRRSNGAAYRLDEQVGFILRRVSQRHMAIFAGHIDNDITPTRWAALAKLYESGPTSQTLLGRRTAMDAATIKGVVDRLTRLHLIETRADPADGRRRVVALTEAGRRLVEKSLARAAAITRKTLAPLSVEEQERFLAFLRRLA